jgi:hypothetical protein
MNHATPCPLGADHRQPGPLSAARRREARRLRAEGRSLASICEHLGASRRHLDAAIGHVPRARKTPASPSPAGLPVAVTT